MKKLLGTVLIALIASTGIVNAQIEEGSTIAGGSLANTQLTFGSAGKTSILLTPKVGYFIQDNIAIGGQVRLGIDKVKDVKAIYEYGVGAFGRYYLGPDEQGVNNFLQYGRWFLEVGAGIGGATGGDLMFNVNFGPGYAYFLTHDIALEASLLYDGNFGSGSRNGLLLNLGFQIHLPSGKYKEMRDNPGAL
ncbi:MAG: hypothetical protein LBR48_02660 [Dysgonamonadaceae bacterium]|jgi:hypothetical protein|nr:hypothetical protein [Dysgonamonadaceae bacterium]